jgi:broad specificity phosphatase PhoE
MKKFCVFFSSLQKSISMKLKLILLSFLFIGSFNISKLGAQEKETISTYYLIRHTEKVTTDKSNRDPELNSIGKEHALHWAETLKTVAFDAIYSTNYIRTQNTAAPIAQQQGLPILTYNPRTLFNAEFQGATKGKTVLIVGHSNTTPAFVNAMLGEKKFNALSEDDYNSLFIVSKQGEHSNPILLNIPFKGSSPSN